MANSSRSVVSLLLLSIAVVYMDGLIQEDVTPLLMHCSYVFLALTHQYVVS